MTIARDRHRPSPSIVSASPPPSPSAAGSSAAPTASTATQQCLSFQLSANVQALLPIQQLTEVLSLPISQIVPIPDVPPAIVGVANWRGEVLWLVDLGHLLGAAPLLSQGYRHSKYTVIVAHDQGCPIGLLVDRVSRMMWIDPAQIQPMPSSQPSIHASPCIQGYWLTASHEPLLVLSTAALVQQFLV